MHLNKNKTKQTRVIFGDFERQDTEVNYFFMSLSHFTIHHVPVYPDLAPSDPVSLCTPSSRVTVEHRVVLSCCMGGARTVGEGSRAAPPGTQPYLKQAVVICCGIHDYRPT